MLTGNNYAVVSVIVRRGKRGIEFLVMDVEKLKGEQAGTVITKFPGGMAEAPDNGNPVKTMGSELQEETDLKLKVGANVVELGKEILGNHLRIYLQVWRSACRGRIRTTEIVDGSDRLGAPYWATIEELEAQPEEMGLCRTHRFILPSLRRIT